MKGQVYGGPRHENNQNDGLWGKGWLETGLEAEGVVAVAASVHRLNDIWEWRAWAGLQGSVTRSTGRTQDTVITGPEAGVG